MKINRAFKDFIFDYNTWLSIVYGGAGAGKSHSIVQKLVIKCLRSPRKVLVMRETGTSLNDSVVALFKDVLIKENIPFTYHKADRVLTFGESTVLFKACENPERIKSIHDVTDIFIEEATEISPELFTQLVLRIRSNADNLQITLAFNPVSKLNWCWRYFFDKDSPEYFLEGRNYIIHKSTYRDNAFLPKEYVDNLLSLKKSNPEYYTIYVEGEFGTTGKLVFPYGSYTIKKLEVPLSAKRIYGCDTGATDAFTIECAALLPDNTIYFYNEYYCREALCKNVKEWVDANIPSTAIIYSDNAGKAQIKELNDLGAYQFKANTKLPGSVVASINKLKSFNIVISPDCVHLIKDFQMYQWKKDKQSGLYSNVEVEREVDGYHCDAIDGARYALEGIGTEVKKLNIKVPLGL